MKNLISVDSLTDIVSNSVGILIIFAVINLIHDNNKIYQLEIPIEHPTELTPVFFMIKNNRILRLDTDTLFSNATRQVTLGAATKKRLFPLNYYNMLGKIDADKGISFYARDTQKWPLANELGKPQSSLTKSLNRIDNDNQFAFFFVYDSTEESDTNRSFNTFRDIRDHLKSRRIKTGWRPISNDAPANICGNYYDTGCAYLPSYLGSQ